MVNIDSALESVKTQMPETNMKKPRITPALLPDFKLLMLHGTVKL